MSDDRVQTPDTIFPPDSELLEQVLAPYKEPARYLRRCYVSVTGGVVSGHGEFAVTEPCHLHEVTGHVNTGDVDISFNTLCLYVIASSLKHCLVPQLAHWSLDDYLGWKGRTLMIECHTRYRRPIDPRSYRGELSFKRVQTKTLSQTMIILDTSFHFSGHDGVGSVRGEARIAMPVDRKVIVASVGR